MTAILLSPSPAAPTARRAAAGGNCSVPLPPLGEEGDPIDHGSMSAGIHSEIAFNVSRNSRAVELVPYLGALGHLVALRASDMAYLHVPPIEDDSSEAVRFGVEVLSPGAYRLFLQFQHDERVHTALFTVQALEGGGHTEMSEHRRDHRMDH